MKVILVSPPVSKFQRYGSKISTMGSLYPPLGLGIIAALCEKANAKVKVIDCGAEELTHQDLTKKIAFYKPDLVGIQILVLSENCVLEAATAIKNISKKINIVLGGPYTLKNNKDLLKKNKSVDFVIKGEGELTFTEFLKVFQKDKNFSKVKGLTYRNNREIVENPPREYLKNVDLSPIPAHHYFPMHKYHGPAFLRGKKVLNIISSRGCPYNCAYCDSLVFGKQHRYHSKERVLTEMQILKNTYGADEIQFYDDTFTLNKKRVFELCEYLLKNNFKISWSCLTRVDCINEELLKVMKKAGCYQIWFGVESGVERILKHIKKYTTREKIYEAFALCKKSGIMTHALFILGLPTETRADSEETINVATSIGANFAQFTHATPFPDTYLYELAKKNGKIINKDLSQYNFFGNIIYLPEGRTTKDLRQIMKKAYRSFYLRFNFLRDTFPYLIKYPLKNLAQLILTGLKQFLTPKTP